MQGLTEHRERVGESGTDWLDASCRETPMWLRSLHAALPVAAVYAVYGEIHDMHLVSVAGGLRPETTVNAIWEVLKASGYDALLTFSPLSGLKVAKRNDSVEEKHVVDCLSRKAGREIVKNQLKHPKDREAVPGRQPSVYDGMAAIAEAVGKSAQPSMALVVEYTSQIREGAVVEDPALKQLMLASLSMANAHALLDGEALRFPRTNGQGQLRRPIIWLLEKPDNLPAWLTSGDGVRLIPVTSPDADARLRMGRILVSRYVDGATVDDVASRFAEATEGFSNRGMFEAVQIAAATGDVGGNIESAARTYRQGLSENPWQSNRLRTQLAEGKAVLERRVLGQEGAVEKVLDVLKRSALGLSSAHQRGKTSAPRGVLYFAGPTGVGKTEMAKAIAELVFADEGALMRFDMSEFQDDHAKIRLVGAPPSYVGYGNGGELTNAIRKRPHAVVLFDEMDKAGREVNDLFLQILSDGRLTDGAGNMASFSEALIVFTSNQGVQSVGSSTRYDMSEPSQVDAYEDGVRTAVEKHFKEGLARPELLGRIGRNIVVFHPIQGRDAETLANRFIDNILSNIRINVGNSIEISPKAREILVRRATAPEELEGGGRGIAAALENALVNPLGRELFAYGSERDLIVTEAGVAQDGSPTLAVEPKSL